MTPGEYILSKKNIQCNVNKATAKVAVVNSGDRPVQVGSHFHFFEINRNLRFDRAKALGMRLNIPAGTAVRFEPGESKEIELVAFGGNRKIIGFSNLINGLDLEKDKALILERIKKFTNKD